MKKIAIIGFGFCGRFSFFRAIEKLQKNDKIIIFDKSGREALGPAFTDFSPYYILNVPAAKMSAFSEKPADFTEFLEKKYPQIWQEIGENGFAPRRIYGEYIAEITEKTFALAQKKNIQIEFVNDEVVMITKESNENFLVTTKNSDIYEANQILLATSFKQSDLPIPTLLQSQSYDAERIVKKLWDEETLAFHRKKFSDEKICLIGSGLTALDVIVGLKNKNFGGKIIVISRRGNFPKKHFAQKNNSSFLKDSSSLADKAEDLARLVSELKLMGSSALSAKDDVVGGHSLMLSICLKIRNFLRANPQFDLRHVIDAIRPITKNLWQNFDEKNKKLFLRFLPYWNIFRHRAPMSSIEMVEEMITSGQIEIKKKGAKNITEKNGKIFVETSDEKIECDYLVNCLGFELRAEKYPLLQQMLSVGLLKKNLLLAQSNDPKIHLLGGLNIGRDFECTAVPDLRVSVENFYE